MDQKLKNQLEILQAYRDVFRGPQGDIVLQDLVNSYILRGNHAETSSNAIVYHEGERAVVLKILGIINQDAKSLIERVEHNANKNKPTI